MNDLGTYEGMLPFVLNRLEDESGVSGTGVVAVGVRLPSGRCVMEWLPEPHTLGVYDKLADVDTIHGHNGKTEMLFASRAAGEFEHFIEGVGSVAVRPSAEAGN